MTKGFQPLTGLRVADFGQLTAGANTSSMLADLGAEVIKIESAAYMDMFRLWNPDGSDEWWNKSPQFHFTNRNKVGVSINLKTEEGRSLVLDLLRHCDILVENFSRGVLDRMGLGFDAVHAVNPALVYASITSQGEDGPNRHHRTYGSTLDAMGGLSAMTGYADGTPLISGGDVNYPDQVVSLVAAGLLLASVRHARATGIGTHVDISQREVVSFLLGEELLAASADPDRRGILRGNFEDGVILQECFRAADGKWLAVTVDNERCEEAVRHLVGDSGPLPASLASWISARDGTEAVRQLGGSGIPAARCNDGNDMLANPALVGGSIVWQDDGTLLKGMPYSFDDAPFEVRRKAPDLGGDTHEVLRSVLRLGDDEIARLEASGVLSNRPAELAL